MNGLVLLLALDPHVALDTGDAAWAAGDRAVARQAWAEAEIVPTRAARSASSIPPSTCSAAAEMEIAASGVRRS